MREKLIYAMGILAALVLTRNLYYIFMVHPDEADQGMIFRIIFFHVPAAWTALLFALVAAIGSICYLVTKNFKWDSLAVSITEVGLAFLAVNLITGAIWARIIWGIWWTWDARLTSALICWILYAGYLMLRHAIDEPSMRARIAAVFSILAFADVPIVWFSIKLWRTQHPQPVVWGGGTIDPNYRTTLFANFLAILLIGVVLTMIRHRQEETQREIYSLRRLAHTVT
jgi:heme exporter protein C